MVLKRIDPDIFCVLFLKPQQTKAGMVLMRLVLTSLVFVYQDTSDSGWHGTDQGDC